MHAACRELLKKAKICLDRLKKKQLKTNKKFKSFLSKNRREAKFPEKILAIEILDIIMLNPSLLFFFVTTTSLFLCTFKVCNFAKSFSSNTRLNLCYPFHFVYLRNAKIWYQTNALNQETNQKQPTQNHNLS